MKYTTSYILLLFLLVSGQSIAQDRVATRNNTKQKILGDTTKVYYTQIINPTLKLQVDTSLNNFEELDPTWDNRQNFLSLENLLATPSFDLYYQAESKGGFRVGLEQFEAYRLKKEDIKYYEVKNHRPYTDLYYSQINQQNNYIKADFGYRFNSNIYFGVQYDLINQTGFYNHHKSRNQNVGFSLRVKTNDARYHGYFNFLTNAAKHQDNGGVTVDTVAGEVEDFLATIGVFSTEAESNYNLTGLYYSQFWYNAGVDSIGGATAATNEWSHKFSYQFNRYKFFDNAPNTTMYSPIQLVNPRGLRVFIRHQAIENEIGFRQALGGSLQDAPLWLKGYVKHSLHLVYQQPRNFVINNLTVGGIIQNNPQYKLKYNIKGQVTSVENRLDFMVKAKVGYDMGKAGYLEGQTLFQRYQPSLMDRKLYVSNDLVWDNEPTFNQIQEFNFGGKYSLPLIGLEAEVLNHTFTNWIYYDSIGVKQTADVINVLQLKVKQDFKVWKMHLDNEIIWQPTFIGKPYFRVPELLFQHNLYFQSHLFKKAMLAKIGVRFRYNTPYYADGYNPLVGAFFVQNTRLIGMVPRIDAYISFRIWQFRFFIRGENLSYLYDDRNYFTAYRRPIHNMVVRIGISWRLFD